MIRYEEFLEEVKNGITKYLPPEFSNADVSIEKGMKVNRDYDALIVRNSDISERTAPTIDVKRIYKSMDDDTSMDDVMKQIAENITVAYNHVKTNPGMFDLDFSLDKVYMQLVNTESNAKLLDDVPHREFHDMSVVYRLLVRGSEDGIESVLIKNSVAESLGWTEEELFKRASVQTQELFPPKVEPVLKMIMNMMGGSGLDDMEIEELAESMGLVNPGPPLTVVTNKYGVNGASAMMYDNVLSDLADKLGGDLYIIPSSVHEILAVPMDVCDVEALTDMVISVNREQVSEDDRLSNQVFHYDQREHKLTMASEPIIKGIKDTDLAVADRVMKQDAPVMPSMSMAMSI